MFFVLYKNKNIFFVTRNKTGYVKHNNILFEQSTI